MVELSKIFRAVAVFLALNLAFGVALFSLVQEVGPALLLIALLSLPLTATVLRLLDGKPLLDAISDDELRDGQV